MMELAPHRNLGAKIAAHNPDLVQAFLDGRYAELNVYCESPAVRPVGFVVGITEQASRFALTGTSRKGVTASFAQEQE
jgi:hypothetical protein